MTIILLFLLFLSFLIDCIFLYFKINISYNFIFSEPLITIPLFCVETILLFLMIYSLAKLINFSRLIYGFISEFDFLNFYNIIVTSNNNIIKFSISIYNIIFKL